MDKNTVIRTGVAGAVAAAGLVVGGVALASADDQASPGSHSDGPRDGGHRGGPGAGMRDTAAFAKALGVTEDKLTAALETVRAHVKGDRPGAGERPDPGVRQATLGKALAKELGISEAKVTAALKDQRTQATADRRTNLSERLDTAVKAGHLTAADKASVLKAYDVGALGGGPR